MKVTSRLSRLGLGTAQFGLPYGITNRNGRVPLDEVRSIIERAEAVGIGLLDTAAAYGIAEETLGSVLDQKAPFRIVTKTTSVSAGLTAVEERARQSLALLRRPAIDTILVHAASDLTGPDGPALWRMLQSLRDQGLFRRIGLSAYVADNPLALSKHYRPDVVQLPFSLADQRCQSDGTLDGLKSLGIEIHARSVFLQGLLLIEPEALPPKLSHAAGSFANLRRKAAEGGASPMQAALAFVLGTSEIDVALVGVSHRRELDEIVSAAILPSSSVDWKACAFDDPVALTPSLW